MHRRVRKGIDKGLVDYTKIIKDYIRLYIRIEIYYYYTIL